jgi:hypothetical protein
VSRSRRHDGRQRLAAVNHQVTTARDLAVLIAVNDSRSYSCILKAVMFAPHRSYYFRRGDSRHGKMRRRAMHLAKSGEV